MHESVNPKYVKIIIVFLLLALFSLCFLFYREYNYLRKIDDINSYKGLIETLRNKKSLSGTDADIVQSWMTFNYLNIIFHIPPNYFKNFLVIADSRYPNLSVGKYAKSVNLSTNILITSVKEAITDYFNSKK